MVRRPPAWWLAAPGRFTDVGRTAARWWLAALLVAMLAAMFAPLGAEPVAEEILHESIVAAMRHGGGFYDALRDLLRAEPDARAAMLYPPALAVVAAAVPGWIMVIAIVAALAATMWNGGTRLAAMFARLSAAVLAVVLLAAGVLAGGLLWSQSAHAGSAAILTALAVVVRRQDRWLYACAIGCVAAVIDPAALLVVAVMAALAWFDSTRREAAGWAIAAVVAASVLAAHLWAVAALHVHIEQALPPGAAVPRLIAAALPGIPVALAGPLLLLALVGWLTIADPLGMRVVAILIAGLALDGVAGLRSATLATVILLPGVAFVPAAVGDLLRAALDRRRITVTRVTR